LLSATTTLRARRFKASLRDTSSAEVSDKTTATASEVDKNDFDDSESSSLAKKKTTLSPKLQIRGCPRN
jgi:hypothetical protein